MSTSRIFLPLRVTISSNNNCYMYLPAEKDDKGRVVRRLIIFRESEVEYAYANQIEPGDDEKFKCYITVGTRSNDLIRESTEHKKYLSEKHHPRNKMNHVMNFWALKGWVFNAEGKPLPSSLSAPPGQSRARTDISKNNHPQTSSQPEKSNKKRKDVNVGPFQVSETESDSGSKIVSSNRNPSTLSRPTDANEERNKPRNETLKVSDNRSVSSNPPALSKTTTANKEKKYRRVRPLMESETESDSDSLFVSERKTAHRKSAAGGRERVERGREKMPIRRSLAKELFPSDEDDDPTASESRHRPKTVEGGKNAEFSMATQKKTDTTDLAGGKSDKKERREKSRLKGVETTGERSRGIARRRDDRSRSPERAPKKPEVQHRRGAAIKKVRKDIGGEHSSRSRGDELATDKGVYYKSRGAYKEGKQTWIEEEIDSEKDTRTHFEKKTAELEKARRTWRENHGTEL